VLIRPAELARIRDGSIDLAFRRWERPRLLAGTRMRTSVGLLEVTSVDRVAASAITAAEARRSGAASRAELLRRLAPKAPLPIWRVGLHYAGEDPRIALRTDAALSSTERAAVVARLDRLDAASPRGPWTRAVLAMIAARPAVRAPDLAATFDQEIVVFKRNVRKLKELGLTESLDIGYRISPRGAALLEHLA
jgi:hypothetical protein